VIRSYTSLHFLLLYLLLSAASAYGDSAHNAAEIDSALKSIGQLINPDNALVMDAA